MKLTTTVFLSVLLTACGSEVSGPDDDGTATPAAQGTPPAPAATGTPSGPVDSNAVPTYEDTPAPHVEPATVTVKVTTSIPEAGRVIVSPVKSHYVVGDVVTLVLPETQSFVFVKWSNGSNDPDLTVTLEDDLQLTAIMLPIPTLSAPASVTGPVDITLDYALNWGSNPPIYKSSQDSFIVEQATSTRGPFVVIHNGIDGTLATDQELVFTRDVGYYFYRVRAVTQYGMTPYSATVRVDRLRAPMVLRIINDLPAGYPWNTWNQVIRLRVGNDVNGAGAAPDRISSVSPRASIGDTVMPGETQDFNVDAFSGRASYYVFVQMGFWDNCIETFGSCFEAHLTQVYGCQGTNYVAPKYSVVVEPDHKEGVREMRLSRFFPAYHYYQSGMCN